MHISVCVITDVAHILTVIIRIRIHIYRCSTIQSTYIAPLKDNYVRWCPQLVFKCVCVCVFIPRRKDQSLNRLASGGKIGSMKLHFLSLRMRADYQYFSFSRSLSFFTSPPLSFFLSLSLSFFPSLSFFLISFYVFPSFSFSLSFFSSAPLAVGSFYSQCRVNVLIL